LIMTRSQFKCPQPNALLTLFLLHLLFLAMNKKRRKTLLMRT
jgi:hypothetical protein